MTSSSPSQTPDRLSGETATPTPGLSAFDEAANDLSLRFDSPSAPVSEDFDAKLTDTQDELSRVRRRTQELEQEKTEFEELTRMRTRFLGGRTQITDRLQRSLARIDHERAEAEARIVHLDAVRAAFATHIESLNGLHPEAWNKDDLRGELARSLGIIEEAELDFTRAEKLLGPETPLAADPAAPAEQTAPSGLDTSFLFWLKAGFAFTLPVSAILVVVAIVRSFF